MARGGGGGGKHLAHDVRLVLRVLFTYAGRIHSSHSVQYITHQVLQEAVDEVGPCHRVDPPQGRLG